MSASRLGPVKAYTMSQARRKAGAREVYHLGVNKGAHMPSVQKDK